LVSSHHIELTPADAGFQDRIIVQEVIKEIAQSRPLDAVKHPFKVVVMHDVDQLSKDAQHALRRTMEKYMATCRLILCCASTGKVIDALQSRCLMLRVPAPSRTAVVRVLRRVAKKESFELPPAIAAAVASSCDRNVRYVCVRSWPARSPRRTGELC
jgi:replication factor C subunit 3/5